MAGYSVQEGGGSAEVCVVSSPELDRTVSVGLTTEDGSAQSEFFIYSKYYDLCISHLSTFIYTQVT